MAEDAQVSNYRAAYTLAIQAGEKLEAFEKIIREVASRFAHGGWKRMGGQSPGALSPFKGWPSGDELHEAVRDYAAKMNRAREAWQQVPQHEQISLPDPLNLTKSE